MFENQAGEFKTQRAGRHDPLDAKGFGDGAQLQSGYPLAMAKDKEVLTIVSMHGGRHYRRQLMDMGLRPGMQVTVLRAAGRGPVLIISGETRLGIGRGMAEKIEVVPVSKTRKS